MPASTRPDTTATPRPDDIPQLLVVTPWYPNPENPSAGAFVRESVRALLPYYADILIIHVENVPEDDHRSAHWADTPEGRLLWIPAPMDPLTSRGGMMLEQREALREHALPYLQHSPLIHCHVGAPTGAALVPLIPAESRLVVTEHATYLPKVFRDPQGRGLYEQAVTRADEFTAVSPSTAWLIESTFPEARAFVSVVPNPVPLDGLPLKPDLDASLSRWLYVGNLVEHKGVRRLVRSFARWVHEGHHPDATLTVVGDGPLRPDLEALAEQLDVGDRVAFPGRAEPDDIGQIYLQHDVLVHLSHVETFGLTCVEAAACGLAVLVTECGAPQDTLVIHASLGLADFVPISDELDVEPVIEGLGRLQRSIDPTQVRVSREHLGRAYGAQTIGRALHSVLANEPVPSPPPHEGLRLLAIAMTAKQARASEAALGNFASFGGGGLYLTSVPVRTALPSSVRVVDMSYVEKQSLLSKIERLLVLRAPALALRGLSAGGRGVSRVAPPAGRVVQRVVERAQAEHRKAAHAFRYRGGYNFLWRNVGPWYTARRLEHEGAFHQLDLSSIDCALLADEFMTPLVVKALRVNPDLDVRSRWTRRAIARIYADRVLSTPSGATGGTTDPLDRDTPTEVELAAVESQAGTPPAEDPEGDNIRS